MIGDEELLQHLTIVIRDDLEKNVCSEQITTDAVGVLNREIDAHERRELTQRIAEHRRGLHFTEVAEMIMEFLDPEEGV